MSHYLVTGVNGFVGQYFCRLLKNRETDLHIIGIDLDATTPCQDHGFEYRQVNLLTEPEAVLKVVVEFQPDYILNLAAVSSVSQSWRNPAACLAGNTGIYANLLEAVRQGCPDARILSVGSSEVYGDQPEGAMPLKETALLKPNNPYGISRVAQESLSRLYQESYGLQIMTTRSFNHIGPGQKEQFVIPSFVSQLVRIAESGKSGEITTGNIDLVRDFSDVRDVVDAYWRILKQGMSGEVYNVCSGKGIRLRDIICTVAEILEIKVITRTDETRIRPKDSKWIIGDNSRIKQSFGWEPEYTLFRTLGDMVSDRIVK